jgi:hypothetical protein
VKIAVQVLEPGPEPPTRRKALDIAMSNALALMSWRDFRSLLGDFTGSGSVALIIGLSLAIAAISALTIEAALTLEAPYRLQPRARWPEDLSESTVPEPPSHANLDGSGRPQ